MHLLLLKYLVPIETLQTQLEAHRAYLETFYLSQNLLVSGPQNPRTGGVIVGQFASSNKIQEFIANDPFTLAEFVEYQVIEFEPVKKSLHLKKWLQV